jgi:spore coat polysaccharide biosynthesis protein SpsF (cytidylyltransferase family)
MRSIDNVIGMVQLRLNSSRVPAKMLSQIGDCELLYWVMYRLKRTGLKHVIICAAEEVKNKDFAEKLSSLAREFGYFLFWGNEDNVAKRFLMAFDSYGRKKNIPQEFQILRVCGDRPFLEKSFLDSLLNSSLDIDIAYNHHINGKLTGFGYELLSHKLSEKIFQRKDLGLLNKEHLTLNIYNDTRYICRPIFPNDINLGELTGDLKFDVDTQEDIIRINALINKFKINKKMDNIYRFLLEGI